MHAFLDMQKHVPNTNNLLLKLPKLGLLLGELRSFFARWRIIKVCKNSCSSAYQVSASFCSQVVQPRFFKTEKMG